MRWLVLCGLATASLAHANDHNNLESGRPLRFDDAYSLAFGEREVQFGAYSYLGRIGVVSSFAFGFAKNQELSIGIDSISGLPPSGEASFFQNLSREIGNAPALGIRASLNANPHEIPEANLRLIATKSLQRYDKIHLNLDLPTNAGIGFLFGYSTPIGYPRQFDHTLVAEVGKHGRENVIGIGIRRQISPRSILDFGAEVGLHLKVTAGISVAF